MSRLFAMNVVVAVKILFNETIKVGSFITFTESKSRYLAHSIKSMMSLDA